MTERMIPSQAAIFLSLLIDLGFILSIKICKRNHRSRSLNLFTACDMNPLQLIITAEFLSIVAQAAIPSKTNCLIERIYDKDLYTERNLVEKLFNKLKNFRRVATLYNKTESAFLSFVQIAGILIFLR